MQHTSFAVQNTSIVDDKEKIKFELLGDPDNAARCMLRVTYDDGSVFEVVFNRQGGQVSQTRRDEKGNLLPLNEGDETPQPVVLGGASQSLDVSDPRNAQAANGPRGIVNNADGSVQRNTGPPGTPAKSFQGVNVPDREKPRPDQGVKPFPLDPSVSQDHNQALGQTDSAREAAADAGVPVRHSNEAQGDDHDEFGAGENASQHDTRDEFKEAQS